MIGAIPPAAVTDARLGAIVLVAALLAWGAAGVLPVPPPLLVGLDATGLALFAVVGTEKALDRDIPRACPRSVWARSAAWAYHWQLPHRP